MEETQISRITAAGSVIVSTLVSFIVLPPVLSTDQAELINWKNVLVFFSGILSIILFNKVSNQRNLKKMSLSSLIVFVIVIGFYQYLVRRYSISCFDEIRVVISYGPVKDDMAQNAKSWQKDPSYPKQFLEAAQCSPLRLWDEHELLKQYYVILILYFLAAALLAILMTSIGKIILKQNYEQ